MVKYSLMYFDIRGIAEPSRWIFAAANQEYEDERVPFTTEKKEWLEIKPSKTYLFLYQFYFAVQ